jgi:hypothetical protein
MNENSLNRQQMLWRIGNHWRQLKFGGQIKTQGYFESERISKVSNDLESEIRSEVSIKRENIC